MLQNIGSFFSSGSNVLFAVFAVLVIGGAVFMISHAKVIHMVVSLAFSFLGIAGLYVLLDAEFLAFVQVLIYAGAVSILMIFGIMMTRHQEENKEERTSPGFRGTLLVGVILFFGILVYCIQKSSLPQSTALQPAPDNTMALGQLLFNQYVIPFELVSVLLTVAFIGAIVLAKREGD